jgi:hypothetical protein
MIQIQRTAITAIGLATVGASLACIVDTRSPSESTGAVSSAVVANGGPDLLWQNQTSGQLEAWILTGLPDGGGSGTQVEPNPLFLSQICASSDGCSNQWQVVDTGDPGGSTTQGNTLLWWNESTGHLRTWNFDSAGNVSIPADPTQTCGMEDGCLNASHAWRPIGRVTLSIPPPPGCTVFCPRTLVQGVLWHDPIAGTVRIWVFDNSGQVQGTFDLTQTCGSAANCSQNWAAKLTADFDGDGNTDILWWNTNGQLQEWLLNPPATLSPLPATVSPKQVGVILSSLCGASNGCSTDWHLVGAADVNGDGHVDLLWHNFQGTFPGAAPGTLRNWLLNGNGGVISTQDLSQQCGPNCSPPWTALGYVYFPLPPPR